MEAIKRVLPAWASDAAALVSNQPSVPIVLLVTLLFTVGIGATILLAVFDTGAGVGARCSPAQWLFSVFVRCGRLRNLLCSPCDRSAQRYPVANTCQIPFFKSLSDIYTFVFGYKMNGTFVEVGAYDGESFSNTSCLADLGWNGHYLEPIPAYAAACRRRHVANPNVKVHTVAAGQKDGVPVTLTPAGPFTSAVDDELQSVATSRLSGALSLLGWTPSAATQTVQTTTTTLDTFWKSQGLVAAGAVDVMVLDVEGLEWPILQGFSIDRWQPKLVIVEIQEKQARFRDNARAQADARSMERYFSAHGYSILYRDVINTVFVHKDVRCVGGD